MESTKRQPTMNDGTKQSQRRASSITNPKKIGGAGGIPLSNEDVTAQRLFEGQDKRVRGGYEDAIANLHNQSASFKNGIADLRTRIKGLSAYNQAKQQSQNQTSYGASSYAYRQQPAQPQYNPDAYKDFDYEAFAKSNNIQIKNNSSGSSNLMMGSQSLGLSEKPRHMKEFETEFFKIFNRR